MPGSGEIKNLGNVAYEILEPVRAKFEKPVMINSGYRCLELNRKIGSSKIAHNILKVWQLTLKLLVLPIFKLLIGLKIIATLTN